MGYVHPDLLEAERFGESGTEGDVFCFCCGIKLAENEENQSDRFGRCFCSGGCKKTFYGGEEL